MNPIFVIVAVVWYLGAGTPTKFAALPIASMDACSLLRTQEISRLAADPTVVAFRVECWSPATKT